MGSAIKWSVPVRVEVGDDGQLRVALPAKAAQGLAVGAGDVLCFTGLGDGVVEVWPVKQNPYSSLDDEGAADDAMERVGRRRDGGDEKS